MKQWAIDCMEKGMLPDWLIRIGIRHLLRERLRELSKDEPTAQTDRFVQQMKASPVAVLTDKANEQHYEVPTQFFQHVLGPRMKYSACVWNETTFSLEAAEEAMLALTCRRAELADGQDILELGCGWGSLSLWMAEKYPKARITAVSNSSTQRTYIENQCAAKSLTNLRVITADMNDFAPESTFDRVVSIEMFEHMRNYEALLERIARWLKPDGKLFVHIFCHRDTPYPFETTSDDDWMGRYFFTGGIMPSEYLLNHFDRHMDVQRQWKVNGKHYAKTLRAWLDLMDAHKDAVMPIMAQTYGEAEAKRWFNRWRVFFMACEELFAIHDGDEWYVGHYLMTHTASA